MKKRIWLVLIGVFASLIAIVLIYRWREANRDEEAFQEQLRLARAERLPTTAAEFAAQIPRAKPEENAALKYRQLKGKFRTKDVPKLIEKIILTSDSAVQSIARKLVTDFAAPLKLVEAAAKLPKCWFDRNWEDGAAVLMPEFADMVAAAKLLRLRAALSASEGNLVAALRDLEITRSIGRHASLEPHIISHLVAERIYGMTATDLALWSFKTRNPLYASELARVIREYPKPDVKSEWSGELHNVLSLVELSKTEAGRAKLGLRPEDIPPAAALFPIILSQSKARADIVKAQRAYWAAFDLPLAQRRPRMETATQDLYMSLLAFPAAARTYSMLSAGDHDPYVARIEEWESRKLLHVALQRALTQNPVPKKLRTDDLRSPFDGKPLTYRFDGKQIVIEVSGYVDMDGKPRLLKLPSDSALGKKSN